MTVPEAVLVRLTVRPVPVPSPLSVTRAVCKVLVSLK